MNDPNEELPVAGFFKDKHAIGLIARIDREKGNIKKELVDKVNLTGKPLGKRLEKAIENDLIEETVRSGDHGQSNRYELTERGKAIQSMLRGMGLDESYRKYLISIRELENTVPDVKAMIEDVGLHRKYVQKDFWSRSDLNTEELDREELLQELEQEEQTPTDSDHSERRGLEEASVDIVDDESDDEDDLSPTETWGTPAEEDDDEEN